MLNRSLATCRASLGALALACCCAWLGCNPTYSIRKAADARHPVVEDGLALGARFEGERGDSSTEPEDFVPVVVGLGRRFRSRLTSSLTSEPRALSVPRRGRAGGQPRGPYRVVERDRQRASGFANHRE
jgi:hypothetical protein